MRVLHCCAPAPAGGIETVIRLLATAQQAAGHQVEVAMTLDSSAPHPYAATLQAAGIPVRTIVVGGRGYRREFSLLRDAVAETQADVLHSHGFRSDTLAAAVRATTRVAHVSTLHGFIGRTRRGRFNEAVQLRALRFADAVVAVSRPVLARARDAGIPTARLAEIPNAVPAPLPAWTRAAARARLALTGDAPVVGWIGRLSHEKGPDVFADAMARLAMPATAVIIGDGPYRQDVVAQLDRAGVHTVAPGLQADAAQFLPAFDVLVLSSRTEGTPIVLLEAMAAGIPIVATAVGGIPDILTSDMATLVPSEDADALAAGIATVLTGHTAAVARAAAAQARWAAKYDVGPWRAAYDAAYVRAAARRGR